MKFCTENLKEFGCEMDKYGWMTVAFLEIIGYLCLNQWLCVIFMSKYWRG